MPGSDVLQCGWYLQWLLRTRRWPAEKIRLYQQRALAALLRHAAATVPYYRKLGLDSAALDGADALAAFPFLTKREVQESEEDLISDAFDRRTLHTSRTSGSTGQPTVTYFDRRAWLLTKQALKLRRTLLDLGRPPYRVLIIGEERLDGSERGRPLVGSLRASIHDGIDAHLDAFSSFRPTGVYGSPSWLLELAQEAKRRGVRPPRARVVWTSSEVLTTGARAEIAEMLGGKVHDVYGSTEFKEVASECRFGRMHVNFESTFVEVVDADAEGRGAIALTSLVNRAMPLIRYRIGDLGKLTEGVCECGSSAPWLEQLAGRETELLELPDGRRISPYELSTLIEAHGAIARYRLVLDGARHLEVQYQLRRRGGDLDTAALTRDIARVVGDAFRLSFRPVEHFERTPAGKHKLLIRSAESALGAS